MKNLLRVFLLFMIALSGYGQATPVTVTNGVISLKGKGKLGGNKDGYQYYQYNTPVSGNFYLQAYFRSLTNSSTSYTGLAFRNIATYQKTDGGVAAVMLVYQNDSLKCLIKSAYNQKATAFLVSGNIKIPGHLKLVKEGNDAKFYYSSQAENAVPISFVSLGSVQDAFLGWSNITQNFITGGNTGAVQTALASKRAFGNLVVPVPDNNGNTGQTLFVNNTKLVPVETTNGKYSPHLFPTIATPLSVDPVLGKLYPNWAVAWQAEGGNFSRNNRTTVDVGVSFMYDRRPFSNAGYGERCLDYFWESNFDTGQEWANGIDPVCNKTINTFTSRIPFHERALSLYGVASDGDRTQWINNSTSWVFDKGVEGVSSRGYGWGDRINGKVNTGLVNCDIEIGLEQGFEYYPKHLSFLLGMGSASQGYVFSQYSAAINEVGANPSFYPNDAGVFPNLRKKIDGTNYLDGNGLTVTNNIPISPDWNPTSKITITDRGITNKGIVDYPNVLPCIEISSTSDMTYRHGETYARKNGWASVNGNDPTYSASNPIENTVVDKFGMDRNTNHIIADIICYGDVNKWWSVNKLNGRKVILQSKITCDRANMGVQWITGFTNQALRFKHYDREYGFDIGGFTALTGCEWQIWDRNTQENLDGYHGAFGVINLMNQRKNFGTSSESYTTLKPRLNFLLWNSEISYDGGSNYVKDKATEYVLFENKLPQRQAISTDGYWVIFAARPEGIEPTSAKFRVTYNGTVYYHTITANDWETTDYGQRNTALANLPLANKDYYYTIIKLGTGGTGTETTVVTPPTITKNVANPTANQSVVLTSSGCQSASYTTKWYDSAEGNLLATSLTYTVNAVNGNGYYAKCVGTTGSSVSSNVITFSITPPPSGGVTITYPSGYTATSFSGNQPKSYWDNQANVPAIFTNVPQYVESTDVVTMQNSQMIIKIDLKAGGQICFAATASNPTKNLVHIGYDRGFQWQADYTQHLEGGVINGQTSGSPQNNIHYNTTQGGDHLNHGTHLTDYYATADGFYTEVRPILYPFNSIMSQVKIQTTYKLVGDMLKINYRYISFRTDPGLETGNAFRFKGFDLPVMFCLEEYSKYAYYAGGSPWTNAPISEGDVPNNTMGGQFKGADATERWAMVWNPSNNQGIGVFNKSVGGNNTTVGFEQLNKYAGNGQGNNTSGAYTVMKVSDTEAVLNGGNYVHESEAWITFGDKNLIRGRFDLIKNN